MEKGTIVINLNNKVIVRDANDVFIWGQVQDISTDSLLIDFGIPQRSPQWLPFDRIFRPPTKVATNLPGHEDPYKPNPRKYIFAATRMDETGPYIWKRSSICHAPPPHFLQKQPEFVFYREVARENKATKEVVPHVRLFLCLFASGLSDKEILTSNPVSAETFCKTSHTADGLGEKWLKMTSSPEYIILNRDSSRAVCLKIGKNTVTVIGLEQPYSTPQKYGVQLNCGRFWDFFRDEGGWDCRSQEDWEKIPTVDKATLKQMSDQVMADIEFPAIRHLHQVILIEVFNNLDTLHQLWLKRVCGQWYSILTLEVVTNHIHIFGKEKPSSWPNGGFIPLATGNGWWYAGWKSPVYRTAKIVNNISSNIKTLHVSGMHMHEEEYEKLFQVFVGLRTDGIKLRTLILEGCLVEKGDFERETQNVPPNMLPDILFNPTSHQILFDIAQNVALVDCTLRIVGQPFPKRDRREFDPRDERTRDVYSDLVLSVDRSFANSIEELVDKCEDMCEDEFPLWRKRDNIKKWIGDSQKVSQGSKALDIMQIVQMWESTLRKTRKMIPVVDRNISTVNVDDLHKLTLHAMWRFITKH